jgi:hypothetical protein
MIMSSAPLKMVKRETREEELHELYTDSNKEAVETANR